jgi:hypothetical protein
MTMMKRFSTLRIVFFTMLFRIVMSRGNKDPPRIPLSIPTGSRDIDKKNRFNPRGGMGGGLTSGSFAGVLFTELASTALDNSAKDLKPSIDDLLIEDNPEYDPDHDSDSDDDSDDDDDNNISDKEDDSPTDKKPDCDSLAQSLMKKTKEKSNKIRTFVKEHRAEILLVIALLAFRAEILSLLFSVLLNLGVTDMLKLIFFVDTMRTLQTDGDWTDRSTSFMGGFLGNSAYVPPVKQHFTFERYVSVEKEIPRLD